jgi:hypothetical protein
MSPRRTRWIEYEFRFTCESRFDRLKIPAVIRQGREGRAGRCDGLEGIRLPRGASEASSAVCLGLVPRREGLPLRACELVGAIGKRVIDLALAVALGTGNVAVRVDDGQRGMNILEREPDHSYPEPVANGVALEAIGHGGFSLPATAREEIGEWSRAYNQAHGGLRRGCQRGIGIGGTESVAAQRFRIGIKPEMCGCGDLNQLAVAREEEGLFVAQAVSTTVVS